MQLDNKLLDELAEKISGGIKTLGQVKGEAETQVRSILESTFTNFDIVTGERMQVQEALLAQAREEIKALESRIKALEPQPKKDATKS